MISLRTYQTWIKRSAEQLDKDVPGWHKKIDFDILCMHDDRRCLCGQLGIAMQPNPDYKVNPDYLFSLGITRSPFDELAFSNLRGFHLGHTTIIKDVDKKYDVQLRLWKHQINKRLKKGA